ncbi:hypothetical protein VOLCADRAFT_86916 [Volvox carteri f. nagariensis]|uniref:Uncharacterized protein n=1 Tax=Volvox carteri f. nagariensis TaxID=3068 RepID=D8TKP7_VOLCA|nr:uncharacterized protein VOLCADRAFT_86916 [Volvox carteri f. nagariensis]EFJ51922.1 hypothetical protein VOLCADRAFT_86916 [Volvox carteri f. nagariensis]|eukprot:XP_002946696.1 hypothetical protein VOLCADRAFT_86916 [Volvox carteri f. nagariensis]
MATASAATSTVATTTVGAAEVGTSRTAAENDALVNALLPPGSSSVLQRQLEVFATLVDEVYESYGGAYTSAGILRRVPYRHQPPAPEPQFNGLTACPRFSQAEAALRSLHEKRRLVRRLTITQHDAYVARELAAEGAAGVGVAAAVALLCGAFGACTPPGGGLPAHLLTNYVVFTAVHMLLHTAILAAAYRTCAWLGKLRSIALGLASLATYYLLLVPTAKPWHRPPASPAPAYLPAALLWPLYGDGIHWRLIHLLSNGFAWAYGTYEWYHSFSCVRLRNGLRY